MRALPLFVTVAVLTILAPVSAQAPPAEAPGAPFARDGPAMVATLKRAAEELKGQNVYDCIEDITTDPIGLYRVMGTPTQQKFIEKYGNVFTQVNSRIKSQVVHFDEGRAGVQGALPPGGNNIIGVLPGKDLHRWVVMGGHYDTQLETVGGAAIDNTSGICTVHEIARAVTALGIEPEVTMVFAWWDGEEWGLFGARAFVKNHNATKELLGLAPDEPVEIVMGHSYDIVGINYPAYNTWPGFGQPTEILEYAVLNLRTAPIDPENFTLCPSYACYTKVKEREDFESRILPAFVNYNALVKEVNYGLLGLPALWVQVADDKYGRSDHMPFIAAGIPGMRIQGSHDTNQWPHYHRASDTLPAAITMAGGQDRLVAGFNQALDAGGLTAIYIAIKGGLGDYGIPAEIPPAPAAPLSAQATMPGLSAALASAAILCLALALRRST